MSDETREWMEDVMPFLDELRWPAFILRVSSSLGSSIDYVSFPPNDEILTLILI